jgi:uncharacterized membrane protein
MFWLALGYPLLAHLGIVLADFRLQWLALDWLLALSLWGALTARRTWAWVALLGSAAALYGLFSMGGGAYALYVPPAVIPAALFIAFARSLRPGEQPWVARVATLMRGAPLPEPLVVYTRQVTLLWCGVFIVMFASAVVLAIWASLELWSLMTNIVHYLVLGAIFVAEFAYRRLRFRDLEPWNLFEYLRRLVRATSKT